MRQLSCSLRRVEESVGRKIVERVLQVVREDRDRTSTSGLPHEGTRALTLTH